MDKETKLTPEQIDHVFIEALGHPARAADKAVVEALGGTVEVLAEYLWDHWFGEPEESTVEDFIAAIKLTLEGTEK